jgi:hypothetical protein
MACPILLDLETKRVDCVAAFVQADIDTRVLVEMPSGFAQPGNVLQLKKSTYGLKHSLSKPYSSTKPAELGFRSCDADACCFVSDTCICLVYVDDTFLFARSQTAIEEERSEAFGDGSEREG